MRVSNQSKKLTTNAAQFAQRDAIFQKMSENQIKIHVINPRDKDNAPGGYIQNSVISLYNKELDLTHNKESEMNSQPFFRESPLRPESTLSSPPYLLRKNLSSQTQKPHFIENSKLLLDVSFNSSNQEKERTNEVDNQKAEPAFAKTQLQITVSELRKTGRLCESFVEAGSKFEEKKSSSKMKLRDYLYMTQTSSKKASLEKHELIEKRKSPSSSGITQPASQTHSSAPKQFRSPQSSSISRQVGTPKYQLSNGKMFQILKKQICQSLRSIHELLDRVEGELLDVESFDKQPTNQQLLVLYNMRREIKEQAQKRVAVTLESLVKSKKSNLLESRAKRQNKTGQKRDINSDQFQRNCI